MDLKPVTGAKDYFPEDKIILNWMFSKWIEVCEKYGYQDFDAPLLEHADLWKVKSGEEIPEQMYAFQDKGGRLLAIRPELTPSLARMVAMKQKELGKPIKWYSIARCWRYERPQAGRNREFFQLNIDCLGSDSLMCDAEIIATGIDIMRNLGLTEKDFFVRLGNRNLIQSLLENAGVKDLKAVSRMIDKKSKLKEGDFELTLKDLGLTEKQINRINEILEINDLSKIKDNDLDEKGKKGLKDFMSLIHYLNAMGLGKFVKVDFSIMRGFDYYTSTVFEVFDASGEFRALLGGGRYDNLVTDFGGEKCPGVGYGMSESSLWLLLKKKGLLPALKLEVDYYVVYMNDNCLEYAYKVAARLRKNFKVGFDVMGNDYKKQLKEATRMGAKNLVFVGDEEVKSKKLKVKNTSTGKDEIVSEDNLY